MRNEKLNALLLRIVPQLGYDHCAHYKYPLMAFLSKPEDSSETRTIVSRGLSQDAIRSELRDILSQDTHLLKCCGNIDPLIQVIDAFFLRKLSSIHFTSVYPPDTQAGLLEAAIVEFQQILYGQGEFEKFACFHLFNVNFLPDHQIKAPYDDWVIRQLEQTAVPRLFGESSFFSYLSPPSTGTWFLVCKDTNGFESEKLYDWLSRRWSAAQPFRQVMQYAVDGILDIDYVVPHFSPDWVNEIQKGGLYYLGLPRRDSILPPLRPFLTPDEQERINRMWRTYLSHRVRITGAGSNLRKALRIAGEFFEDFHRKTSRVEQFSSLIIALEALFTPSEKAELSFRISQSCALLACESQDSAGRHKAFEFLKEMFRRRGKLFHGQFDSMVESSNGLASDAEVKELASLVRRSILRFMSIYLRGENDLERLRRDLQRAALDEHLRDDLLSRGDFEALIDDSQTLLLLPLETKPDMTTQG